MSGKIIIFGAGASHGSDSSDLVPPLGENLLDQLARFNPPGWGKIPQEQFGLFQKDFEEGMREFGLKYPHALPPLQRAMAAFFFNFIPTTGSLYIKLAQRIKNKNWEGVLATFNYERLLELSLSYAQIRPVINKEPDSQSEIELVLPHGCCHLFCEAVRGSASGISFSGFGVSTDGPIRVIPNSQEFQQRIVSDAFPPVMSYFEPSKRTTSGVSFIKNQRERFANLVKQADKIGIVGLRVREHDLHIWEPVANSSAKIIYLSGASAGEEFRTWAIKNNKEDYTILPYYFNDGFEDFCSSLDL